jgi:DNA-binding transcriptional LysR family regulator
MDLKRLRYFVTVARMQSFTRAAEALHMAQPPLSQRIQELENEIGAPLLDRESRPLALTPAGQLLFDQAVQIVQKTDSMMSSMRRMLDNKRPIFTFGVVPTNFHGSLSAIIRKYRRALPRMEVRIKELSNVEQEAALLDGRIDAGISRIEIETEGVKRIVLRNEPMVVALPDDHPLATLEDAIPLSAIKDEPFILYTGNPCPSLAHHVVAALQARGTVLTNPIEVDQHDTALIMIAAGIGLSIVPAAARLVDAPGVTYRPLADIVNSPIVLCHRSNDDSSELQTLYYVLAEFLEERGHPIPPGLHERSVTPVELAEANPLRAKANAVRDAF